MDTIQCLFANVKSEAFYLNHSSTRELQIYLKSIAPTVDFVFKLTATDHSCQIEFSRDTWNEIVQRSEDIRETMSCEIMREIFSNDELRVFTEERHEQCALCFVDRHEIRVNMMIRTFKKMMSVSYSISSSFEKLLDEIQKIAAGAETFINMLVAKYQQCEVNNTAYANYLSDLQNNIRQLQALPNDHSLEVDYNDDEDSDEEDYRHRRRRYF